jgi:hypothetical protein
MNPQSRYLNEIGYEVHAFCNMTEMQCDGMIIASPHPYYDDAILDNTIGILQD